MSWLAKWRNERAQLSRTFTLRHAQSLARSIAVSADGKTCGGCKFLIDRGCTKFGISVFTQEAPACRRWEAKS